MKYRQQEGMQSERRLTRSSSAHTSKPDNGEVNPSIPNFTNRQTATATGSSSSSKPIMGAKKTVAKKPKSSTKKKRPGRFRIAYTNRKAIKALSQSGTNELSMDSMSFMTDEEKLLLSSWGLPLPILSRYRQKGITSLFQWQLDCLDNERVLKGSNILYSAPTSAGKTLVAEVLMLKRVLELGKKAIFILPFVSVAREKMYSLQELFGDVGIRVEGFMGSYNPPGGFQQVDIAICTIEKANSLVNRLLEEGGLSQLGTVVVDELHLIGDPRRGYLLELLLTKIRFAIFSTRKQLQQNSSMTMSLSSASISQQECSLDYNRPDKRLCIQIIGMSATLPNLPALAKWLEAELVVSNYRPVPLVEHVKIGDSLFNSSLERTGPALKDSLCLLQNDPDHIMSLSLETILDGHSILAFCPSKQMCETTAVRIAKEFFRIGDPGDTSGRSVVLGEKLRQQLQGPKISEVLAQLAQCPSGLDEALRKAVSFGVAFHHAGLTFDERDIIESAFKRGIIRVMVATSTLSAGVNLPARRVLIVTPTFDALDILTYRQMSGRAGRKGVDTHGESILICDARTQQRALNLIQANLPPVKSALFGSNGSVTSSLKRALLEVIASGVVRSPAEIEDYTRCTLLHHVGTSHDDTNSDLDASGTERENNQTITKCLEFLEKNDFIRVKHYESEGRPPEYMTTQLGSACLASSLSPDEGILVFKELQKARRCFVLENELHVIYQVTPIYIADQWRDLDWNQFLKIWQSLTQDQKDVAKLIGVHERFIIDAMMGVVSWKNPSQMASLSIHQRFFTALALNDLVNEMPISQVTKKYSVNKGVVQTLQQSASTFAGMVTAFCNRLGWFNLELLLSQFQERLQFGVQRELVDLVRLDLLNGQRARILHNAGIKTIAELATSEPATIAQIFHKAGPFSSNVHGGQSANIWVIGKNEGITETDAAQMIVQEARDFLQIELGLADVQFRRIESQTDVEVDNQNPEIIDEQQEVNLPVRTKIEVIDIEDSVHNESITEAMEVGNISFHNRSAAKVADLSRNHHHTTVHNDSADQILSAFFKDSTFQANSPLTITSLVAAMNHSTPVNHEQQDGNASPVDHHLSQYAGISLLSGGSDLNRALDDVDYDQQFLNARIDISSSTNENDNQNKEGIGGNEFHEMMVGFNERDFLDSKSFTHDVAEKADETGLLDQEDQPQEGSMERMTTSFMDVCLDGMDEDMQNDEDLNQLSEYLSDSILVAAAAMVDDDDGLIDVEGPNDTRTARDNASLKSASSTDWTDCFQSSFVESPAQSPPCPKKVTPKSAEPVSTSSASVTLSDDDDADFLPTPTPRNSRVLTPEIPYSELLPCLNVFRTEFEIRRITKAELVPEKVFRSDEAIGLGLIITLPTSRRISMGIGNRILGKRPSMSTRHQDVHCLALCNGTTKTVWLYEWSSTDEFGLQGIFKKLNASSPPVAILSGKEKMKQLLQNSGVSLSQLPGDNRIWDPKVAQWLLRFDEDRVITQDEMVRFWIDGSDSRKLQRYRAASKNSKFGKGVVESMLAWKLMVMLKEKLSSAGLWKHFVEVESPCIRSLLLMELNGFKISCQRLDELKELLEFHAAVLELSAYRIAGRQFNLASSKDIGQILRKDLGLEDELTGRGTGKQILKKVNHEFAKVILEWRKVTGALWKIVLPFSTENVGGRIHGHYAHFTVTGRVVMAEPSIQCVPRDFHLTMFYNEAQIEEIRHHSSIKFGHKVALLLEKIEQHDVDFTQTLISPRGTFIASNGFVLLSADYSQMELRILAHLSQEPKLLDILNRPSGDVFRQIAAEWKCIPECAVTDEMRHETKGITYGLIYGMGSKALSEQLEVDEREAAEFIRGFMWAYPGIRCFIDQTIKSCREVGYVETISGRRRYLDNINSNSSSQRSQAERQAVNSRIQGSASDLVKKAMTEIQAKLQLLCPSSVNHVKVSSEGNCSQDKLLAFPVLNLHDELIYEVRETHLHLIVTQIKTVMESSLKLDVQTPVVIKCGHTWGSLQPYKI